MITGVIKNKVDKIWTDIWAGGITNPLTVIEQLTYLMFIRSLDEKELENEEFENMTGEAMEKIFPQSAAGQSMRWSKFKDKDPRDIFNIISQRVFPAIKKLKYGRLPDFNDNGELVEIEDARMASSVTEGTSDVPKWYPTDNIEITQAQVNELIKLIRKDKHKFYLSIVVIFFLGILLIFSTYAWFSTSLNVRIKTFNMIVTKNSGLSISFDAINYDSELNHHLTNVNYMLKINCCAKSTG